MRYRLLVARRAEVQIRDAAQWWLDNRSMAPRAFEEDIEKAFDFVTLLPRIGHAVQHTRISGLRRLLLGRVSHYLYYHVNDEMETVEVLALWHTSRSGHPRLR